MMRAAAMAMSRPRRDGVVGKVAGVQPAPPVLEMLTKYAARESNDPAEDRATAVLAARLRSHGPFAAELLDSWGAPAFEPAAITPQRPVRRANGKRIRIDLEIRVAIIVCGL